MYDKFARQLLPKEGGEGGERKKTVPKKGLSQQLNRHFQNRIYREVQPSSHSRLYVPNNRHVINSRFVRPPYTPIYIASISVLIGIRPVPSIGRKFSHCHFGARARKRYNGWLYVTLARAPASVSQRRSISPRAQHSQRFLRWRRRECDWHGVFRRGNNFLGAGSNGGREKKTRACRWFPRT